MGLTSKCKATFSGKGNSYLKASCLQYLLTLLPCSKLLSEEIETKQNKRGKTYFQIEKSRKVLIFQRSGGRETLWREEVAAERGYWLKEAKGEQRRGGCTPARESEAQTGRSITLHPQLIPPLLQALNACNSSNVPNTHPIQTQNHKWNSSISNKSCSQAKWHAFNSSVSLFKFPLVVVSSIFFTQTVVMRSLSTLFLGTVPESPDRGSALIINLSL